MKRQDDANLLAPTGTISVISLPLPRVQPASVARTSGRLLVYAPESLRISPKEAKGLRPISPAEAVQNIGSTRDGRFPQLRELIAYAYTQEAAGLTVEGQRRKPYIEARELLAAHIESGVVRYEATLFFDIKYSSVKTLRIDVPKDIADKVRNLTPALRDERIEPQPADVANDYVAWQLVGEGELLGSVTAKFTWEEKSGELKVGQASDIKLPQIKAVGVDRFWGQIVATKAETIEISVKDEPKGLRPIDPQRDLMAGADVPNAARAFEFHEDWSLNLQATRYQLEEVKRTSIDRAFVRMVVTRGDKVAVQALYRLRSARQRVPLKIPDVDPKNTAGALDSQPLRINNQSAPLEHDGTQFFIPLTGHSADEPVLVELRYTVPGNPSSLQLPEFQDDPAVQQVYLAVWLPEEWKLLGIGGPWTNENAAGTWNCASFGRAGRCGTLVASPPGNRELPDGRRRFSCRWEALPVLDAPARGRQRGSAAADSGASQRGQRGSVLDRRDRWPGIDAPPRRHAAVVAGGIDRGDRARRRLCSNIGRGAFGPATLFSHWPGAPRLERAVLGLVHAGICRLAIVAFPQCRGCHRGRRCRDHSHRSAG